MFYLSRQAIVQGSPGIFEENVYSIAREWVTYANSEVRAVSFPPLVGNGFSVENLISYSIKITEAFRLDYVVNLKVNKRKGVISK